MFNHYRELGLSLIPLKKGQKYPTMENWSIYSERLPTEDEAELWDRLWASGHRSVGLVTGPASNVVAVDLDHPDDPELNDLCPLSPVRKRGKKGETRFFRPFPGLSSISRNGIDILWTGRQTVLPPSPHPEIPGGQYVWLTEDTIENFDVSDLPILDLNFLDRYVTMFEARYPHLCKHSRATDGGKVGRNNWLKDMVWAKRMAQESEEDIIEAIYQMDLHRNTPRLFTDEKENFKALTEAEAKMNAWRFVVNVTKTFINKKAGDAPQSRLSEILVLGNADTRKSEKFKTKAYPMPSGLLGDMTKAIMKSSFRNQPGLAISGAIAVGSTLIANKFRFGTTWPNAYIMSVAPTGAGKNAPQEFAKRILASELGRDDLLGYGNYSSSIAIAKDLGSKRERLDIIDEASTLFKSIAEGGVFQSSMDDTLCTLFSCGGSLFMGSESAAREGVRVWNPCVSVHLSTTPTGLKDSITKAVALKGFFPRIVPFIEYEYSEKKKPENIEEEILKIGAIARDIRAIELPDEKGKPRNLLANALNPIDIPCSPEALTLLDKQDLIWDMMMQETHRSEVERNMLTRVTEQSKKLALIHGALRSRKIDVQDVEWAIETLNTARENAMHLLPQLSAENRTESNVERMYAIVKDWGVISHRELMNKTRFLQKRERNEILESLVEEQKIQKTNSDKGAVWSILK